MKKYILGILLALIIFVTINPEFLSSEVNNGG